MATSKREDQIGSVIVALVSVAYLVGAFFIQKPVYKQQLGPEAFPKAVGFLLVLLSLVYLYQAFVGRIKEDESRAAIIGAEEKVEQKANLKRMGSIVLIMIGYAALFSPLGYPIATFLAMFAALMVLDRKKIVRDLIISLVISVGLFMVFNFVLRVELPQGILAFLWN